MGSIGRRASGLGARLTEVNEPTRMSYMTKTDFDRISKASSRGLSEIKARGGSMLIFASVCVCVCVFACASAYQWNKDAGILNAFLHCQSNYPL